MRNSDSSGHRRKLIGDFGSPGGRVMFHRRWGQNRVFLAVGFFLLLCLWFVFEIRVPESLNVKSVDRKSSSSRPRINLDAVAKDPDDIFFKHLYLFNDYAAKMVEWLGVPLVVPDWSEEDLLLSNIMPKVRSSILKKALIIHADMIRKAKAGGAEKAEPGRLTEISPMIHQLWLSLKKNSPSPPIYPQSVLNSAQSFRNCSAGMMTHFLWETPDVEDLVTLLYPAFSPIFHSINITMIRADFTKYLITYAVGGVYSDLDVTCLKNPHDWTQLNNFQPGDPPADHFRDARFIVGVEGDCSAWGPKTEDLEECKYFYARFDPLQLGSWTFAVSAAYPGMFHVMQGVTHHLLVGGDKACIIGAEQFDSNTLDLAGPGAWTDMVRLVLRRHGLDGLALLSNMREPRVLDQEIVILPAVGFSPGHWKGISIHEDEHSPKACAQHHFAGTWRRNEPTPSPIPTLAPAEPPAPPEPASPPA